MAIIAKLLSKSERSLQEICREEGYRLLSATVESTASGRLIRVHTNKGSFAVFAKLELELEVGAAVDITKPIMGFVNKDDNFIVTDVVIVKPTAKKKRAR